MTTTTGKAKPRRNMANPISNFIRQVFGGSQNKRGIPGNPDAARPLVPFGEFAPFAYQLWTPDWSLLQQIEQYHSWVYACVTKIASEFSAVNLKLYKMDKSGNIEQVDTHPALDLLDRVNPFMTFYDLKDLTITNLELTGNAYWWLIKNKAGDIVQIYPWLRPDRMTPIPSVDKFIDKYRYIQPGIYDPVDFETDEIIHFKYINPRDPYSGISAVRAGGMAITVDEFAQKYNLKFFQNGARPDFVLQFKDGLDDTQAKRIMDKWEERHGQGNEHRPAVLSKGEVKPTSLSQKDMEFYNQRMMSRDEILAMFKVPKSLLGIVEDVNRANAESSLLMFVKQVIVPKVEKFTQYLNEFLLPQFKDGDSLFFDYDNPAPEDQTMRMEYYQNGIQNGWLSPNEVRALEGFAPYDGGNTVFIPFNVVPGGDTSQTTAVKGLINGQIKELHIPRRFKFNIKPPSRTDAARREALMTEAIKETKLASRLAKSMRDNTISAKTVKKITDVTAIKNLSPEKLRGMWDHIWKMKINKTDRQEKLMMLLMQREFARQQRQVLASMPNPEKSYSTKSVGFDFNVDDESKIFLTIFNPLFADIIRDHGKDAMDLLGRDSFDSQSASQQYKKDWVMKFSKDVNDTTRQAIKDAIDLGIKNGDDVNTIRESVQGVFKDASAARALTIARTEVARASNFGTLEAYKQSGVVTYTEWYTAHDEAVCYLCAPMDGQKTYLDSNYLDKGDSYLGANNKSMDASYGPVQAGSLHPNCRCVLIPHTDDAEFFDKSKSEDAFNLKGFDGSDAEVNANAIDQINNTTGVKGTMLEKYAKNLDWQLQYTDINNVAAYAGDEDLVAEYAKRMQAGDKFPPIAGQIMSGENQIQIIDGNHRLEALKRLGAKTIPILIGRPKGGA